MLDRGRGLDLVIICLQGYALATQKYQLLCKPLHYNDSHLSKHQRLSACIHPLSTPNALYDKLLQSLHLRKGTHTTCGTCTLWHTESLASRATLQFVCALFRV